MTEYLCDDDIAKSVIQSLLKYGVAFIEKVPPNAQSTELCIKRLFPIKSTHLGETFVIANSQSANNGLSAHTATSYLDDAAGLVAMHCIQTPKSGGETYLIDGFNILNNIHTQDSMVYGRLMQSIVTHQFVDEENNFQYSGPLVKLNGVTNVAQQIRFDPKCFAPHLISDTTIMNQFYKDMKHLSNEVQNLNNRWFVDMPKGRVVIFNNWRLLHGWEAFTGKRSVCCAFVSFSDFMSKARSMNLVV